MKINPKALGLAGGVIWGLGIAILTLISIKTGNGADGVGYARLVLSLVMDVYPGYAITLQGAIIGFIWGFVDAFIGGYLLAWLYNWFAKKYN